MDFIGNMFPELVFNKVNKFLQQAWELLSFQEIKHRHTETAQLKQTKTALTMIVLGNFKIKMFIKVSFNYLVDLLSNYINFVVLFLNKMLNFESI